MPGAEDMPGGGPTAWLVCPLATVRERLESVPRPGGAPMPGGALAAG